MSVTPSKRGRPKDPDKSDEILKIAGTLFMSEGYHATRMEDIATMAGMSKLTLYSRFPDKEALFSAVIRHRCQQHIPDSLFEVFDLAAPKEAIFFFTKEFISLVLSHEPISMYRMLGAVANNHSELAKLFFEAGPKRIKVLLYEKLKKLNDEGLLNIDDPMAAQEMLTSMVHGSEMHMHLFLNIGKKPSLVEIENLAKKITENFLRCWSVNPHVKIDT